MKPYLGTGDNINNDIKPGLPGSRGNLTLSKQVISNQYPVL